MYTIAFIGPSGTGKSHRSQGLANKMKAEAIIDDGLLISKNKVLAGYSAKKESTKVAAVKRALFTKEDHIQNVKAAIKENKIERIMVLGTSKKMVERIASALEISPIDKIIHIEDVATTAEIEEASYMRNKEGKHVIPVPAVEIRKDFSGYFLHPLKQIRRTLGRSINIFEDKSIVRPTFSYMGDYTISDGVVSNIAEYEALRFDGIEKVSDIYINNLSDGIEISLSLFVKYGCDIKSTALNVQRAVKKSIYHHTSVNVKRVEISVKKIVLE